VLAEYRLTAVARLSFGCGLARCRFTNSALHSLASKASTKEETTVPTKVQFTSGESMTVAEGLDQANQQLGTQIAGLFNRVEGDNHTRVTVFASAVAYLQEMPDEEVGGGLL
jgi:hypothetical protein